MIKLDLPGVAEPVAVVVHHLEVVAAETGGVCFGTDIILHIGRAEDEGDGMLLGLAFQVAERTFVVCVEGIHQRDGCNRFFHGNLRFFSYNL